MTVNLLGYPDSALTALSEAAAILDELGATDPTNRDWRRNRADKAVRRADVLLSRGELESARAILAPAMLVLEELVKADTARLERRRELAHAEVVASALELRAGRPQAARDLAAAAMALLADSTRSVSPRWVLRHGASAHLLEGRALAQLGDVEGAKTRWREVERLTASLLASGDDPPVLATAVEARLHLGRRSEVEELLARLRRTGYREAGFVQRVSNLGVRY